MCCRGLNGCQHYGPIFLMIYGYSVMYLEPTKMILVFIEAHMYVDREDR